MVNALVLIISISLLVVFGSGGCYDAKAKIIFATDRDGNYEIYLMDLNGFGPTGLTKNTKDESSPSLLPITGSKIAFVSRRDENTEIYIMDVDGSNQVNLTMDIADDAAPCFSPWGF